MKMDYLIQNYPYVIRSADAFYYSQCGGTCTCGVRVDTEMEGQGDIRRIKYDNRSFAVLCFEGLSQYEQSRDILMNWLYENGIEQQGSCLLCMM